MAGITSGSALFLVLVFSFLYSSSCTTEAANRGGKPGISPKEGKERAKNGGFRRLEGTTRDEYLQFPKYDFTRHPMHTQGQFSPFRSQPVVMRRYIRMNRSKKETSGMFFTPGKAAYNHYKSGKPFCRGLDALYVSQIFGWFVDKKFLQVDLNHPARVFLLLVHTRMREPYLGAVGKIRGLDARWKNPTVIQTRNKQPIQIGSVGRGTKYTLPAIAIVVETYIRKGETLILPNPRSLKVFAMRDIAVSNYALLFARPGKSTGMPHAFEYPDTPKKVTDLITRSRITVSEKIKPNEPCPKWLHDLYIVPTRDMIEARRQREPLYWRTWHPMVDPIYWCYFDHEHGSYPGKYLPMLGYTAWKTFDPSTPDKRQVETNEGFKVFSIPLHSQEKYVIITVHMHGALARRFSERHHTMIFAVLNRRWKIELELHMKADFGFGAAFTKRGVTVPLNKEQAALRKKLLTQKMGHRRRRFNIINLDNYPKNVNDVFEKRLGLKPTMKNMHNVGLGAYERWFGTLNTCSRSDTYEVSFNFDFRRMGTAKKRFGDADDRPMQYLLGHSIDRKIAVPSRGGNGIYVKPSLCKFKNVPGNFKPPTNGVFYTDSYFAEVRGGPGPYSPRQYMSPKFRGAHFRSGFYSAMDNWCGHFDYDPHHRLRRHTNIEGAVLRNKN